MKKISPAIRSKFDLLFEKITLCCLQITKMTLLTRLSYRSALALNLCRKSNVSSTSSADISKSTERKFYSTENETENLPARLNATLTCIYACEYVNCSVIQLTNVHIC
jgi:hypothetical protein